MHFSCSFAREKVRSVCQSYFTSRLNVTVLSISIQEIVKFFQDQNIIDFLNLAIEENLLVQAKEIYDNFVMRELLIRQRKRSDCSRKAEGPFDRFFGIFTLNQVVKLWKVTPNSSPPPNDEGEYEPISKTEDTGDQLIGKFQNNSFLYQICPGRFAN